MLKDIALSCGIAENRPSKWNVDPAFRAALTRALAETHAYLSAAARASLYQQAVSGNLAAFDRIRNVERDIEALSRPADPNGLPLPGADVSGVHIHVHSIPERQPMSALPPPLTLPAASPVPPPSPAK